MVIEILFSMETVKKQGGVIELALFTLVLLFYCV